MERRLNPPPAAAENLCAASPEDLARQGFRRLPASLELCGGENLYKLAAPVFQPELSATLHLLLDREASRPRRPAPRRDEEARRLIQRAKELLLDVNRMSEEEAPPASSAAGVVK